MIAAITKKILFTILMLVTVCYSYGQTHDGWRGVNRSGIYNESSLLKSWPSSGPAQIWESNEAGNGFSSAVVTDDAVYITGKKGENDVLTAFTPDGKKKWETIYGKVSNSNYPDSRSTPSVSNGKIFVVSGEGDMVCIGKDGKVIWSVNYFLKYSSQAPRFGISESPLIVDDKVIGTPGGNKAAMVAFNTATGKVVWETPPLNEGTQYTNPLLIESNGKKMIITLSTGHIIGVDPASGKLLWKYNYEAENEVQTGRRNHTNTPLYRDGFLFAANGYEQVAVKLKINWDGSAPSLIWKNTDITPHVGGMVLVGNNIFSSTHDTNSKGRWICVDWATGKTNWTTDWYNKGSVIFADGMLYLYEEKNGFIGLAKPDSQKLDVVSKFQITRGSGPYWAHPVINKGKLYIRHGEYLASYLIKSGTTF